LFWSGIVEDIRTYWKSIIREGNQLKIDNYTFILYNVVFIPEN